MALCRNISPDIPSGETFNTIHGDLVAEHINKESKAVPYRSGYISNHNTVKK